MNILPSELLRDMSSPEEQWKWRGQQIGAHLKQALAQTINAWVSITTFITKMFTKHGTVSAPVEMPGLVTSKMLWSAQSAASFDSIIQVGATVKERTHGKKPPSDRHSTWVDRHSIRAAVTQMTVIAGGKMSIGIEFVSERCWPHFPSGRSAVAVPPTLCPGSSNSTSQSCWRKARQDHVGGLSSSSL